MGRRIVYYLMLFEGHRGSRVWANVLIAIKLLLSAWPPVHRELIAGNEEKVIRAALDASPLRLSIPLTWLSCHKYPVTHWSNVLSYSLKLLLHKVLLHKIPWYISRQ